MRVSTKIDEKQLLEIFKKHFKEKNIDVCNLQIHKYNSDDSRETSEGYIELNLIIPE